MLGGQRGQGHVRPHHRLAAQRPADEPGQDPDLGRGDPQQRGHGQLDRLDALARVIQRQLIAVPHRCGGQHLDRVVVVGGEPDRRVDADLGSREPGRAGHVTHPGQRPDPQPAVRQVLDQVQRQVVDVDQQPWPQHVLAHQVHLGSAAGQERAVRALPDQRDRPTGVDGPYITEWPHHRSPPTASRTPRIAARIFGYAAHRQILPLIHSAISASSPAWPSSSSFTADMIWPGVQYPHWNASCSPNRAHSAEARRR